MTSRKASGSGTQKSRSFAFSGLPAQRERGSGTVLLTGFGPFPGVVRNPSADLAIELARLAPLRHLGFDYVAHVLPVDWAAAPAALTEMLHRHQPVAALHFGVSSRATGFVIESHAYNATRALPDETGNLAALRCLVAGDRPRRASTLPVRGIVKVLKSAGYAAELSSDPGRYLCNAVLFHSLRISARTAQRARTGFVHIPATLDPANDGMTSRLQWPQAVEGGLRLLEASLATLQFGKRPLS